MTDLHTHILPGMDDGPRDLETARHLLQLQLRQGVRRIALTSHYHPEMEPLDAFLHRREAAFEALQNICPPELTLKKGCEVVIFFDGFIRESYPAQITASDVMLVIEENETP